MTELEAPTPRWPSHSSTTRRSTHLQEWHPLTAREQRKLKELVQKQFENQRAEKLRQFQEALSAMLLIRGDARGAITRSGFRPRGTNFFGSGGDSSSPTDEFIWEAQELAPPPNQHLDIQTAYPALFLLQAAAGLQGDDKEFLVQQAGFAMQRGAFAVSVPENVPAKLAAEVQAFASKQETVFQKQAVFDELHRQRAQVAVELKTLETQKVQVTAAMDTYDREALQALVKGEQQPTADKKEGDDDDDLLRRAQELLAKTETELKKLNQQDGDIKRKQEHAAEELKKTVAERTDLFAHIPPMPVK